jgi:hypothetical protein
MIRPPRTRLTNRQREDLWDCECVKATQAGRGENPICNICGCPIIPPSAWHESHDPYLPHALGGPVTGIAHDRCNLGHSNIHDKPLIAKSDRVRQKFIGAHRSSQPFYGWRKFDGRPVKGDKWS